MGECGSNGVQSWWNPSAVPATRYCQQSNHDGWGWGRLGDSGWCFCAFVLLPIMATTRPLLPVVTAWQPQLHLCPPSLPNSLCLATICTNYSYQNAYLIVSLLLWAIGSAASNLISLLFNTHSELLAVSLAPVSTSLPSSFSTLTYLPTFRFFYTWISQMYLCIEQGILWWMIAVQIVVISVGIDRPVELLTLPFPRCHSTNFFWLVFVWYDFFILLSFLYLFVLNYSKQYIDLY